MKLGCEVHARSRPSLLDALFACGFPTSSCKELDDYEALQSSSFQLAASSVYLQVATVKHLGEYIIHVATPNFQFVDG
ncbi:hypothetical protein EG68_05833 [Paragonimus skrjabini miyazakii]|uniref:Uncharacterized protein n=1 Tax=Paragonimus skrjabini miyazakii TaxID=59628 RepID=A0A8S9YPF4_9TREM|nr:hypothetical protein EG68_05833 [Paragonimus skrjabini miyazakii]